MAHCEVFDVTQNVVWEQTKIGRADRERQAGHRGLCLWFTGMSGSGKSTIAKAVEQRLHAAGMRTYLLDGDNLRHGLNADLGFSEADRKENVRRVGEVARLFVDAGVVVMAALISPFRQDRDAVRAKFEEGSFVEVFVDCPISVCASRDPKGLYQKALAGAIPEFTGVSSPYEPPEAPEIHLHTAEQSVQACVAQVLEAITPLLRVDQATAVCES
ncbi:MAG: adenylyl-sulfate kinase [Alicyclobacillus sp.]|nr:adenylyl-sulfate kinase [Alicyclobacillus sp.]